MPVSARTEADRLRVILETLAYADPNIKLADALPTIWEIEKQTAKLESVSTVPVVHASSVKGTSILTDQKPRTISEWVATQQDIIDLIPGHKIQAIKEVRVRCVVRTRGVPVSYSGVGLKEAKEGVEYWERHRSSKA